MSDTVVLDGALSLLNQLDGEAGTVIKVGHDTGIDTIVFNSDYTLTFNMTNGETFTTGSIRGEQGQQGTKGEQGDDYVLTAQDKAEIASLVTQTVYVSGTTPVIVGEANTRYICGEVASLDFTPPASGICDVVFTSGTTPTVLVVPSTVKWANGFDPTSLDADTTYELNIMDGLGVAGAWT